MTQAVIDEIFPGDSEVSALLRNQDWGHSPLGPVESWPQSLKTSISICLNSAFPILVWWGPELVMLYNDAYAPIISNKHPRALGQPGRGIFPEVWETIGPMLDGVMLRGTAVRANDLPLFLERNGYQEECYFTFSYSPILDESGRVGGVFTPVHETTERVINERRLKTLSRLAEVRAEQAANALSASQSLSLVLAENPIDLPFTAIYLFDEKHEYARRCATTGVFAPSLAPEVVNKETEWPPVAAILEGKFEVVEPDFMPADEVPLGYWGRPVTQLAAIPLKNAGTDIPKGFLAASVHPAKRLDEAYTSFLLLVADHISGAISDAEAFEQERRRAEALAEIDRAKTVFFSNISHEFRTPLTLMSGPIQEILADEKLNPTVRERLELAQRNSLRLQKLVNNLLDFSRIEAGRVEAVFEPVDLVALTQDLVSSFRSAFERAGLSLELLVLSPIPTVHVDRDMWEKIVLNLLSNAFKFTLSGGVKVELFAEGERVHVAVVDTGTGIPAGEQAKIFERFQRVEGAIGRSFEGTGIGLALVLELVRLHGGTITVESTEGVGSRFEVVVPTATAHLDDRQIGKPPAAALTSSRVEAFVNEVLRWIPEEDLNESVREDLIAESKMMTLQSPDGFTPRRRVLIADDNADMRVYLRRLLSDTYEVAAVSNGGEALAAIHQQRPDLVLSDVMMPAMDGLELVKAIRSDPALVSLPVLLLSARAGEEAEVEGLSTGADDYLIKPFSSRELLARISSALKIAELRAEAQRLIREREEELREVLERTTDAVFVLDSDWNFRYLNPNAVSLVASGRDLVGKNIWEEFPDATERNFYREYHRAMAERVPVRFEEFYPEPLNKWFTVHAYPTKEGIAVFFHDDTTRRRSEAALRQTEKLAAAGRLAASISHEINNPLEAVTNLLYLVEHDGSLSAQGKELLGLAQQEMSRVSHIANQTLRFYRQSTNPTRMDMSEVLDSVIALHKLRYRNKPEIIERQFRKCRQFPVYEGELRQVFSNLIGNASDAIGADGRIVVRIHPAMDWKTGREGVRVTVADNGSGMSRETRLRLFEPFFSTKGVTGTGLGLWVSKEMVEKHGGFVQVRSSQREGVSGSTFSVFLPISGETQEQA
jgi:PAS domain S-box-containing protein